MFSCCCCRSAVFQKISKICFLCSWLIFVGHLRRHLSEHGGWISLCEIWRFSFDCDWYGLPEFLNLLVKVGFHIDGFLILFLPLDSFKLSLLIGVCSESVESLLELDGDKELQNELDDVDEERELKYLDNTRWFSWCIVWISIGIIVVWRWWWHSIFLAQVWGTSIFHGDQIGYFLVVCGNIAYRSFVFWFVKLITNFSRFIIWKKKKCE